MKLSYIFYLFLFVIVSCKQVNQEQYTYPSLDNISKKVIEHKIEYTNNFSNLENVEKVDNQSWFKKQDSITQSYFISNGIADYKLNTESLNKEGIANYWYKKAGESFFYWQDNDSTQVLFKGNIKQTEVNPVFSATYDSTIHFYAPNNDGSKYILFISNDTGDFLKVIDSNTGKALFSTSKDMNSQQQSYAIWVSDNKLVFTGWPNKDNSRNSYLALADIETGNIKIILTGDMISEYNPEYFLRPNISIGSDLLQAYLVDASEHFTGFTTKLSEVNNNIKWNPLYKQKDSILFYPEEKENNFYFLRYKNGKKTLVKNTLESIDEPNEDVILFLPKEGEELTEIAFSKSNVYALTSYNGVDAKLYVLNQENQMELLDLDYPISSLTFYNSGINSDTITLMLSSWKSNYTFLNIDDNLNISNNINMTRQTPEILNDLENEIIEIESHDGTMVPLTIIKPKNFKPGTDNKAIIYAYGAYGFAADALYNASILDFVQKGNIFAVAHVRGGSEKGLNWYINGIKEKKFNSWKDLLSSSQYLKDSGYVGNDKLGVLFSSAGGITCGMAINEDPTMFRAAVGSMPMLNPLRLGYQPNYNASDNDYDFGNKDNLDGFKSLLAMDPVINLNNTSDYPSTLLIHGKLDDLVPVFDSAKYIASLQKMHPVSSRAYLLDIIEDKGHNLSADDTRLKAIVFFDKEL